MSYRKFALAVPASACLSFGKIAPTHADTVIVAGTIAPYLWNGSSYYVAPLIDPGIFGPAGTSLTGDAIQIVWNIEPITATVTINGTSVTLGPATGFFAASAQVTPTYQNITVQLGPNVAINSFDDFAYVAKFNPLGIGGSFDLIGPNSTVLDGYYFVTDVLNPLAVPAPIVGDGPLGLLACALLIVGFVRKYRVRLVDAATAPTKPLKAR